MKDKAVFAKIIIKIKAIPLLLRHPAQNIYFQRLRFGEFLADNIVCLINLFTYLLTYLLGLQI